jgi:hypothetical protein
MLLVRILTVFEAAAHAWNFERHKDFRKCTSVLEYDVIRQR